MLLLNGNQAFIRMLFLVQQWKITCIRRLILQHRDYTKQEQNAARRYFEEAERGSKSTVSLAN